MKKYLLKTFTIILVGLLLFFYLPFLLYFQDMHWLWSLAVSLSCFTIYLNIIFYKALKKYKLKTKLIAVSLVVLVTFNFIVLRPINNFKTKDTESEYSNLHPMLKIAVKNLVIMDKKMMITDVARNKKFYMKRGMKINPKSAHYLINGRVHAVDIRTQNVNFIKNFMINMYFRSLGFYVLRHGGTGDHLHIQIPGRLIK